MDGAGPERRKSPEPINGGLGAFVMRSGSLRPPLRTTRAPVLGPEHQQDSDRESYDADPQETFRGGYIVVLGKAIDRIPMLIDIINPEFIETRPMDEVAGRGTPWGPS